MSYQVKQSTTAYPLLFLMVDSTDHVTGKTGLTPTVTISKAGAAFGSPAGAVTEIANGWYKVAGNTTDSATLGPLILHATGTAADPVDMIYEVVAYDPQDTVRLGLTAIPNVASGSAGAIVTAGTGTAQLSVTSGGINVVNANVINASALATDAVTEIQSGLATQASVNTIDDFLDTEVAAILAAVDTEVAAIKAKTDQLTFTVANQVDANSESINAAPVLGDGTSGNKWRG